MTMHDITEAEYDDFCAWVDSHQGSYYEILRLLGRNEGQSFTEFLRRIYDGDVVSVLGSFWEEIDRAMKADQTPREAIVSSPPPSILVSAGQCRQFVDYCRRNGLQPEDVVKQVVPRPEGLTRDRVQQWIYTTQGVAETIRTDKAAWCAVVRRFGLTLG